MELRMGETIAGLRKARGMTQEQLAAALGVSGPAVSKWETDSSCPDITLLCPLARALGTDVDTLLSFEEELTEEKLEACMTELVETTGEGRAEQAEETLNRLLRDYPTNIPLKFSATAILSLFEMLCDESGTEDRERWKKRKRELCRAVYDSGNPAFRLPAVSLLASLELADDELEKAEALLRENPANTEELTSLWVQLYLKKGDREKALATVQRQLYSLVGKVQTCLMSMLEAGFALGAEQTEEICDALRKMSRTFRVGGGLESGLFAEVYLRQGHREKAMEYLEELTDSLTKPAEAPNPLLFAPAVALQEKMTAGRHLRRTILQALEKDEVLQPLRGEMRFELLVHRLRESLA